MEGKFFLVQSFCDGRENFSRIFGPFDTEEAANDRCEVEFERDPESAWVVSAIESVADLDAEDSDE